MQIAPEARNVSRLQVYIALAIIYVVWGSTYLAIRFAIESMPGMLMLGARYLTAGLILFFIALVKGAKLPDIYQLRDALIIGILLLLFGNGAVTIAEKEVPSGIVAIIVAIVPLWFVLIDWLIFKSPKPGLRTFLGLALGFAGIILLIGPGNIASEGSFPIGYSLLLLGGSLSWAFGSIYGARKAKQPESPLMGTAVQMLGGGIIMAIISVSGGELSGFQPEQVSSKSILSLLYLIVFGSLIAFTAYSWLVRVAPPKLVSTYAYVNPVIAVLLGWGLADEVMSLQSLIGAGIIVAAVVIISGRRVRKRVPAPVAD